MKSSGLVHVYYGDGKGKTTAALGLALRAYGQDFRVTILQFFKGSFTGELAALERLPGIRVMRGENKGKFLSAMTQAEKDMMLKDHDRLLSKAAALVKSGECDLLVLDEGLDAVSLSMLDEGILRDLLNSKPDGVEIVITGHKPVDWIMDRADYITEMVKHRHPYDHGITARRGIEY